MLPEDSAMGLWEVMKGNNATGIMVLVYMYYFLTIQYMKQFKIEVLVLTK